MNKRETASDKLSDAIATFRNRSNASLPAFSDADVADVAKFQARGCFNEYRREFGKKRAVEILTLLARVYTAFSAELSNLLQQE